MSQPHPRPPAAPTYRQFAQSVLNSVRGIADTFTTPDDDWAPMALLDMRSGLLPVALSPDYFASDATKDALVCTYLPALITSTRARKLALVLSAWMSVVPATAATLADVEQDRWPGGMRPSQDPNRQEIVAVSIYDAERAECHIARIIRDGRRLPRLAKWDEAKVAPDEVGGRFVDVRLLDALR